MTIITLVITLFLGTVAADPPAVAEQPKLRVGDRMVETGPILPLFDGDSLRAWKGDPKFWSVEDGAIVGRSTADNPCTTTTYLHHAGTFADFELEFEIKLEGAGSNSGMQYRSTPAGPNVTDGHDLSGYQADFDINHRYSGILYETRGRGIAVNRGESIRFKPDGTRVEIAPRRPDPELRKKLQAVDADQKSKGWHQYRIVAFGPRLEHWIDGERMALIEDQSPQAASKGILALQVHQGAPMTVRVRNIRIRELAIPEAGEISTD
ncbi:MAG: DUF1080 domain-containing protein [Phycisphaerales bacterium]|nr:DUF1080 domain-containing protein [Phycisphaerales bacterium]